ncbi:aminotransferase class I/II-fold pyridoxal phosphate-dependent enzyme [Flavobacterium sp. Sd200]|uniref:pyridoxal phosphate-dependent aminotransferase n=1 Tax=Flavobacterium sp. Sd200 TaxID=2692211 RepID=UPI00136F8D2F|nr:aminotransferase class I/II-fold pyridoxal phosphate-dependent enzyme [Flavobacterium sp. Sd200]MXN91042.1 aminotransferase class I/II-fold pyridoxal phosphate-dependent enzyme [Flavobacterium sp. Sd200]
MIAAAQRLEEVKEYYFSAKLREVRQMVADGKKVINMGIGSPDLPPSQTVLEAISSSFTDAKAHEYQSYQGLPELREAIAGFYSNHFGVSLNPANEILPLMGSKEGIMHISMAFLNEGDKVLIPNPGYPTYTSATKLVGGVPVFYNLSDTNNWEPDFEALEASDLSGVKIMWVNYPHMPTGAKGNKAMFEKLIAFAKKHDILLVNDNPYSFVLNTEQLSVFQVEGAKDVALELNSLSKTFNMAGWRVGMVSGSAAHIDAVLKVKSNMDSGMFYGIQKGAIAALNSSDEWFTNLNEIYARRRNLIFKLADLLGCTYDANTAGLFVWAKLPGGIANAEAYVDSILYDKHIFLTPGTVFGSAGEGYVRFSLCAPEEVIEEAIKRF